MISHLSKEHNKEIAHLPIKIRLQDKQIKNLTESFLKYKNLFNNSDNAIFFVNLNGMIDEVNQAACERHGYSFDEFTKVSFFEIVAKSERIFFKKHFKEISSKESFVIETLCIIKYGNSIPVEIIAKIFKFDDIKLVQIIAKDISSRKTYQKELENEKDLLKTLMDNIPDTIYFKDLNSRFIRINNAQAGLLGINSCETAIGKTDFDFFIAKHAETTFRDEKDIFKTKKSLISKLEHIKTSNGKSKWVTATKVPIFDKNGNVSGLVGMSRDITSLKKAENKILRYTKELQHLNATKDKFFSILAHDLKNPFFSLMGFIELLKNNYNELSEEDKREYIDNIFKISKNSYSLLENLLQWASSQSGRIEYCPKEIDLKILIDESTEFFNPIAQKKDIFIKNNVGNPVLVYADPDMMKTIIRNFITNAIKFTENEGVIQINATEAKFHYNITISDCGIGMDSETIKNLFRIDVNHKTMGTSNEVGSGLGLIICKEFVEKNGGDISISSKLGKGSKFTFTVPKHA